MASEPWYSVGPNDVFPEEFPRFLFADLGQRRLFASLHGALRRRLLKGLQDAIRQGKVIDVFPIGARPTATDAVPSAKSVERPGARSVADVKRRNKAAPVQQRMATLRASTRPELDYAVHIGRMAPM